MADTFTAALNLTKIEVGASEDTWGDKINANMETLDKAAANFATIAAFTAANTTTPGLGMADGMVVRAGGYEFRRLAASTAIPGRAGWVPNGKSTPFHFGAVGDNVADDRPAFVAMNAYGGDAYIPKPPVRYNVATAVNLDRVGITVDPTTSWEALTDAGNITWNTNLFTQQTPPVPVHRFNGRVFMGDAAHEMAGGWDTLAGGSEDRGPLAWYANSTPVFGGYTHRDATVAIANGKGTTALALSSRASQQWNSAWDAPIGLGIFMWNDGNGEIWSTTWGGIIEGRASQLQGNTLGLEVALGNISGVSKKITPYNWNTGDSGGVHGFWMQGAGDATFGTPSNAPNNSAMVILKGFSNTTLDGGWRAGIVFTEDALTGTDGSAASTTYATAISMGRMHRIEWNEPTTDTVGFSISSNVQNASQAIRMVAGDSSVTFRRGDTAELLGGIRGQITNGGDTAHCILQNGIGEAQFRVEGPSPNLDLRLVPQGTGRLRFGVFTGTGDVPVVGHIEVKDNNGIVRKLAVVA